MSDDDQQLEVGDVLEATVMRAVGGILEVPLQGGKIGLLPLGKCGRYARRAGLSRDDPTQWEGVSLRVQVMSFGNTSHGEVVHLDADWAGREHRCTEGEVHDGVVTNVVDYGLFVEIGGLGGPSGLLHLLDLVSPHEGFTQGQSLRVRVIKADSNLGFAEVVETA